MRKRAEAARRKRIDHVFVKADDNSNGKITPQQMLKLFAANGEVCSLMLNLIQYKQNQGRFYEIAKKQVRIQYNDITL